MYYCEGKNCSRRDHCAYHEVFDSKEPRQYLDQSTNGTVVTGLDIHGNNTHKETWNCGDNADYYRHYQALGYRNEEEYKNSKNNNYDEICVTCEHHKLCFILLEDAGLLTRNGKRIMCHICEHVKKDPQYYISKLKKRWGDEQIEKLLKE